MNKHHWINNNNFAQSKEEWLSTPSHDLLSSSSLDFSPKVGDNLNKLGGTNKDDSHINLEFMTIFPMSLNIRTSTNSNPKDEEEYFQHLIPTKPKIKREFKNINKLMEMTKQMETLLVDVDNNDNMKLWNYEIMEDHAQFLDLTPTKGLHIPNATEWEVAMQTK